jgi:hypothetical protein
MNSIRKDATIAGALFVIGTVAGVLSISPVLDGPDDLIKGAANENRLITGALFRLIMAAAHVGLAISLYPILRKYDEGLAIGFVSFRSIAGRT